MERPSKRKTKGTDASHHVGRQADNKDRLHHAHRCARGDVSKDGVKEDTCCRDTFRHLFGFGAGELRTWKGFVRLMSRPADPACLAYFRISYGILMLLDIFNERGLSSADLWWGDTEQCRFPLFDFLRPLPLQWMVILYLVMVLGAAGIVLGVNYRVSCLMHLLPYWYLLLLEKSRWNNHSYLFGILSFLLLLCDANRYWSLDGLFHTKIRNADVPMWNYALLRTQVFLVYFLAGLKKLDVDWVNGYSMTYLSSHWVFNPFKLLMTESQVDLLVVHLGGLTIDLFMGFLLFFDKTRLLGVLISTSFHLMNSQIFEIGMFPYAMMALTPLFFYANWPRSMFRMIPRSMRILTPDDDDDDTQPSQHCLYTKDQAKAELIVSSDYKDKGHKQSSPATRASFQHHAAAVFAIIFIVWQMFLPYSHFITKGYNSWTQGLYGYSWDMMVHSRSSQHIRITYVNKDTGDRGYLNPEVWSTSQRWTHNPDMIKQYSNCIAKHLQQHNIHNVELYFDIWISLNKRFQQRIVNPHVNIMTAEWSAFRTTPWIMPLLVDLSDWRTKLTEIQDKLFNSSDLYEVVFVADFPGMHLENYVNLGIGNFTIRALKGQVIVEVIPEEDSPSSPYNITLHQGQDVKIPTGVFHNVHTVSDEPSCYMYIYINTEEAAFLENLKEFEQSINGSLDNPVPDKFAKDPKLDQYKEVLREKKRTVAGDDLNSSLKATFFKFLRKQYSDLVRGLKLIKGAVTCVFTGDSFYDYVKEMNKHLEVVSKNTAQ
ncbi:hypothetical protein ACOMHN_000948 [Nucella lapillus]